MAAQTFATAFTGVSVRQAVQVRHSKPNFLGGGEDIMPHHR
jgi:hypothetical protein